jgi:prolyl oligopeptidase
VLADRLPLTLSAPPVTVRQPFSYVLHGERIEDPYRWLEGGAAPEAASDPALDAAVTRWTDEQNAYARSVLDALPGRATVSAELEALLSLPAWGTPQDAGNWLCFTLRSGNEAQAVLYVAHGQDGEPRELVNVNRLDPSGQLALAWYEPSRDGRYVAFGTYRAGDEKTICRVLETRTGEWLADEVAGRVDPVDWLDDGQHFVVRRLKDAANPYSGQITLHRLGRPPAEDAVLFEQYAEGPLATTWGPSPIVDPRGRWLIVAYYTGTDSNDLWCYDLDEWRRSGALVRRDLIVCQAALTTGFIDGDCFYALTTLSASNKRVVAFDLGSTGPQHYRELIATRPDAVIVGMAPAAERIVVEYLVDAQSRIEIFDRSGRSLCAVELPAIGSASIATHAERTVAWLRFENFAEPASLHRVDLATGRTALWRRTQLRGAAGSPPLVVTQVTYRSFDDTRVPMFVVHRADMPLDGSNPTVLYGYGGFDISLTPAFLAAWRPWLVRGGVYAVANLRGGGERGAEWHRAGMLERKQNVFDDFHAAAEWLVARGYTSSERLGIRGGSNGGLLTGVTVTQRPELAAAAIVAVPLLDMLRYEHFLMARYWVPEYGSAENPGQFPYLLAYSPYHHVVSGTAYPAVLLTAGENDSRVHPMHARKFAAALQAATASSPDEKPVLLRVDRDVGHGPGKPLELRIRDAADELLFMAQQLRLEIRRAGVSIMPP